MARGLQYGWLVIQNGLDAKTKDSSKEAEWGLKLLGYMIVYMVTD